MQGGRKVVADWLPTDWRGRRKIARVIWSQGGFVCCRWNLSATKPILERFLVVARMSRTGNHVWNHRQIDSLNFPNELADSHETQFPSTKLHAQMVTENVCVNYSSWSTKRMTEEISNARHFPLNQYFHLSFTSTRYLLISIVLFKWYCGHQWKMLMLLRRLSKSTIVAL